LWCTSTIPQVLHIVQLFSKELLQLLEERFLLVHKSNFTPLYIYNRTRLLAHLLLLSLFLLLPHPCSYTSCFSPCSWPSFCFCSSFCSCLFLVPTLPASVLAHGPPSAFVPLSAPASPLLLPLLLQSLLMALLLLLSLFLLLPHPCSYPSCFSPCFRSSFPCLYPCPISSVHAPVPPIQTLLLILILLLRRSLLSCPAPAPPVVYTVFKSSPNPALSMLLVFTLLLLL